MKALTLLCGVALVVTLGSCSEMQTPPKSMSKSSSTVTSMKDVHSGYASSEDDRRAFLSCWAKGSTRGTIAATESAEQRRFTAALEGTERQLTGPLPSSYRHFAIVTGGAWVDSREGISQYPNSLLEVGRVGRFKDVDRSNWLSWEKARGGEKQDEVSASDYYRYGPPANPSQYQDRFRWQHIDNLLKVGELEQGAILALNPKEITSDGEWEAWLLSPQLGAKRYRSFAELLQHVAYQDILDVGGFFLTADKLRAKCAGLLKTAATP